MTMARVTSADVGRFREDGWIRLGRIAPTEQVAELVDEEKRFRLDRGFGAGHNDTLRVNIQLCNRSAVIRTFCTVGPHIEALQLLLGPNVCLTHQQFVTKLPDSGEQRSDIPLHQDNGYGRSTAELELTLPRPVERRSGCVSVPCPSGNAISSP